jgi:hypothetical protein
MRIMMGAPGPMPLGLDGFPGGKPKGSGLVKVHPTVADLVERFRSPVMFPPSDKERCLIGTMIKAAAIRDSVPAYRITGLDPADACPGDLLTITGRNFGTYGSVVFPCTAAPILNTSALE